MANPQRIKCRVSQIEYHGDAVSVIRLMPLRRVPNFQPGQFLHLALDPFDPTGGFWPESRVFSIASTPSDPELTIAYAVKGSFTEKMRGQLAIGKEIWVRLPYGHFSMVASPGEEIVLVAGGTGITPFISFLSSELQRPTGTLLKLVYGVRKPEFILFADTLLGAMSGLKGFRLFAYSETVDNHNDKLPINEGSLSTEKVWEAAEEPEQVMFYLSGPVAMIDVFKKGLTQRGVKEERIRIDEWE